MKKSCSWTQISSELQLTSTVTDRSGLGRYHSLPHAEYICLYHTEKLLQLIPKDLAESCRSKNQDEHFLGYPKLFLQKKVIYHKIVNSAFRNSINRMSFSESHPVPSAIGPIYIHQRFMRQVFTCLNHGKRTQRCWSCLEGPKLLFVWQTWSVLEFLWDFQANKVLRITPNKIPGKNYSLAALQQLRKTLAYIRKGRLLTQKCFTVGLTTIIGFCN